MKPTWKPQRVKLGQIQAWEGNPRMSTKAQAQRIIASERKFGQPVPFLLAPEVDGRFLLYDGHQRLAAWFTVYGADYEMDAMVSDRALTEAEHKELIITLHTGATGSWNWDALSSWSAGDLQEWGMNGDALKGWNNDANNLKELLNADNTEPVDAEPQIDRAAELAEKWQTESGQLWKLGEHRLLIGDCTVRENVERLMGGERAVLMVTDPPYGVDYGELVRGRENQKKEGWDDIKNDALSDEDLQNLLTLSLHGAGANVGFVFHPPGERRWLFWSAVKENGWTVSQEIVWVKNAMVFGRADYQWRHEPCLYIKKDGARKKQEDRTQTTVWEIDKPHNSIHPTQKPVELFEIAIRNHTENNELIYEPFAGSGTTIIAAHNLNRRCYAMEISEKYGAVILERFCTATGITPELID